MGDGTTVTTRTFVIKEGMKPKDVIESPYTTAQQKKMAYVFDSDGVAGYSQREADVFNATAITDHGKNGVSLWTKYADGTIKETLVKGDIASFKYAPQGDIKPTSLSLSKPSKPASKIVKNGKSTETRFVKDKNSNLQYPANYTRVEIGKGGIVSADTTYYTGTDKPKAIHYRKKDKKVPVSEFFNENGQFTSSIKYDYEYVPGRYVPYTLYNAQGRKEAEGLYAINDDTQREVFYERYFHDEKNPTNVTFSTDRDIKTGKLIEQYADGYIYKYKPDGSYTTKKWGDGGYVIESYSAKGKLVNKQQLDLDDVLKYTVTPRYNSDGIVIKNDTTWNQKK